MDVQGIGEALNLWRFVYAVGTAALVCVIVAGLRAQYEIRREY